LKLWATVTTVNFKVGRVTVTPPETFTTPTFPAASFFSSSSIITPDAEGRVYEDGCQLSQ